MVSVKKTYALIRKLASINGPDVNKNLLDRVMYNSEVLSHWGKEYWWFIFFGQDKKQIMLMIFNKFGKSIIFNDEVMTLRKIQENRFQAITAGWIYDGNELRELEDTNPIITIDPQEKVLASTISNKELTLQGSFPNYKLTLDGLINLNITKGWFPEDKLAHGVSIPPLGVGWVDIYSKVEGTVFGKKFKGTGHLQKVVGIMPYGSFHWGRIVFQNGSSTSFFCLKTGKDSKRLFIKSLAFYDHNNKKFIRFEEPKLKILRKDEKKIFWIIEGRDNEKKLKMTLEVYAKKQFTIKNGGSQVYIEYAVTSKEFNLKTKDEVITLSDLGEGIGTFEDAYSSSIWFKYGASLIDLLGNAYQHTHQ